MLTLQDQERKPINAGPGCAGYLQTNTQDQKKVQGKKSSSQKDIFAKLNFQKVLVGLS